jgi:hypothetical protein
MDMEFGTGSAACFNYEENKIRECLLPSIQTTMTSSPLSKNVVTETSFEPSGCVREKEVLD